MASCAHSPTFLLFYRRRICASGRVRRHGMLMPEEIAHILLLACGDLRIVPFSVRGHTSATLGMSSFALRNEVPHIMIGRVLSGTSSSTSSGRGTHQLLEACCQEQPFDGCNQSIDPCLRLCGRCFDIICSFMYYVDVDGGASLSGVSGG